VEDDLTTRGNVGCCISDRGSDAGKNAIDADSVRKRGRSVTAACQDVSRGSKVSLLAAFYISEEEYQQEVLARGTLPSNLPIPCERIPVIPQMC